MSITDVLCLEYCIIFCFLYIVIIVKDISAASLLNFMSMHNYAHMSIVTELNH